MCVHDVVRESYVSLFNALLANLKHMTGKQLNDPEDVPVSVRKYFEYLVDLIGPSWHS